jgi:methionyl-tRNA synthetase
LLLTQFPFGNDGDVSLSRLDEKYNSDLASGLGNLVARVVTLAGKLSPKANQPRAEKAKPSLSKKKSLNLEEIKGKYNLAFENLKIDEALGIIWELIGVCDKIIVTEKPWEEKKNSKEVISNLLFAISQIADLLKPFMPQTAEKIAGQIKTGKSEPLFPRLI